MAPTARLIIVRHGNTFAAGQTPRRVGARTDLPLTPEGEEQAARVAAYLQQAGITVDAVYTSALARTRRTGAIIAGAFPAITPTAVPWLNEIDYGPDENQTDDAVTARIGADALRAWDKDGIMPPGWSPGPDVIAASWHDFARARPASSTTLLVTSNGIARFAGHLTGDWAAFRETHGLKMPTGGVSVLEKDGDDDFWRVALWGQRP